MTVEHRAWRKAFAWILAASATRLTIAWLVPLLPDETYYWEWTRHLSAGYFDHPPGVALLIKAGVLIFGDTAAGVRIGPAATALATHGAAVLLAWSLAGRQQSGAEASERAAMLVAVLPIAAVGLVPATPDAALFACATLALFAIERALAAPIRTTAATCWWIGAGVALGAALVAKYMAILLPAGLVLACLAHPPLRARFREPGPYIAATIAALFFMPVLIWNRNNDWVSFRFQLGHGFGAATRGTPISRELELLGGQLGLATPVLFALLAAAVWVALRDGWRNRHQSSATDIATRRFALASASAVPLLFFAVSAWRRTVEANWPALMYPGALALLASSNAHWARGKWWRSGLTLAATLLAVVLLQAWRPLLPIPARNDPFGRAHGWQQLASAVATTAPNSP